MSGPKISFYEMTGWQKANFNAQVRCENDTFACIAQIKVQLEKLQFAQYDLNNIQTYGSENHEVLNIVNEVLEESNRIEKDINAIVKEISISTPVPSVKITMTEEELKRKKQILKKFKEILKKVRMLQDEVVALKTKSEKISDIIQSDTMEAVGSAFSDDFVIPDNDREAVIDKAISDARNALIAKMNEVSGMELSEELQKQKTEIISKLQGIRNLDFIQNYEAVTVVPFIKQCRTYIEARMEHGEEFDELYSRYTYLCQINNIEPKQIDLSAENIAFLQEEIGKMEGAMLKQKEEEYIADSIDEVMEEMGYDLIGNRSVTKKNGRRFKDELYHFNEGTAVNIRYDSQGQITMELGGLDTADRTPTPDETAKLCDDMQAFCAEFKELERRLAKRGIVCKNRISIMPPTEEYAQIINTEDYDMQTAVETFKAESRTMKTESKKFQRL